MQQQLDALRAQVGQSLAENAQTLQRVNESLGQRLDANLQIVGQRFTETTGMVTTVHEKLKGLEEAATRIFEVGKDLTSLQEILQPPKLRGGVGEVLLENLLRDRLPPSRYAMQHRFSNGTFVDAVIRLENRVVPVDSKFPVENFRAMLRAATDDERARARREFIRQVQGHIKTIAEKYILPAEGTFDFALMYVPAENVYYEAIVQGDEPEGLYAFAMERRVIPVSPTTFYAYLVALVYGLKGLQVEQQAAKIREGLAHLLGDLDRVRRAMDTLGQQLRHAQVNYARASEALDRFHLRLQTVSGASLPEPQVLPLGDGDDARS
jgi:DNA recombination protein RmuC